MEYESYASLVTTSTQTVPAKHEWRAWESFSTAQLRGHLNWHYKDRFGDWCFIDWSNPDISRSTLLRNLWSEIPGGIVEILDDDPLHEGPFFSQADGVVSTEIDDEFAGLLQ